MKFLLIFLIGVVSLASFQNQNVVAESAILTLNPLPESIKEGEFITFSGTLVSASGEPIPKAVIQIKEDDLGPDEIIITTRTNDNGFYSVKIKAWNWDSLTTTNSEIYAKFNGNEKYDEVDTERYSIRVYDSFEKNPTELILDNFSLKSALVDDVVTFTGTLTSYGSPVLGVIIEIKEDDPGLPDEFLASGKTDSRGKFLIRWNIERAGVIEKEFDIYAVFQGDDKYSKARSTNQPLSIYKSQTWITLDSIPTVANIGEQIIFTGTLKFEKGSTKGAIVYIKDEDTWNPDDLLATAWVDSSGRFSTTWIVKKNDPNNDLEIYAEFKGNEIFSRSTTCGSGCLDTQKLRIDTTPIPPPTPTKPSTILPHEEFMKLYYSLNFDTEPVVAIVPTPDSYDEASRYIFPAQEGVLMWSSSLYQQYKGNWNVDFVVVSPNSAFFEKKPDVIINLVTHEEDADCFDVHGGIARIWNVKQKSTNVCTTSYGKPRPLDSVASTAAHEFIHAVGLGHIFNKPGDLMCSVEKGIPTCPPQIISSGGKPSDFNLAAVVAMYNKDGYLNPNNQFSKNTKFTYTDFLNIEKGTYPGPKTKTFTPEVTSKNTDTPKPIVSSPVICGSGTHFENGKCVLDENYNTSFYIDDIKKQLEIISQIISEQLRSIYEKIISQVPK